MRQAEKGLAELASTVDTVLSIPNDRLLELVPKGTSFFEAFKLADDVLRQAVQGISDIITTPGLINRDFSDIRAIMLGMGYAMMGTATCRGERAPVEAARQAICSPLLEEGGVKGARGVLINITASSRLSLHDVNEACSLIRGATTNEDVQINFGVVLDEGMEDEVKITVIATGFQRENLPAITQLARAAAAGVGETVVETVRPVEPEFSTFPFVAEPEPEPVVEAGADAEAEPESAPQVQTEEPALSMNDLDVPAYLRRNRRVH